MSNINSLVGRTLPSLRPSAAQIALEEAPAAEEEGEEDRGGGHAMTGVDLEEEGSDRTEEVA